MTDRLKGLTVTLGQNIREDDIEPLLIAIRQMKGVIDVVGIPVDSGDHINQLRAELELEHEILGIFERRRKERNR